MGRWLWNNLRTLLVAFFLAGLVWLVAVNEDNPVEEKVFEPVPLQLLHLPPQLMLMNATVPGAAVTVRAPHSVWGALTTDQIQLSADLANLSAGTHVVKLTGRLEGIPARVVKLEPAVVTVILEERETRTLPVQLHLTGEPAQGYEAGQPNIVPLSITVSGPISRIRLIEEVQVSVSVAGLKNDYNRALAPTPLEGVGLPVEEVLLQPALVQVHVPITQKHGFREVTVSPVITGQVASGYRLTNITVAPLVVTVSSADPLLVSNLPGYVETQPVVVDNWKDDRIVLVGLALPVGVTQVDSQTVLVQISIAAIDSSLALPQPVEFEGLAAGLEAQAEPPQVEVRLGGPLPVLNTLPTGAVRLVADLTGLGIGAHTVPLQALLESAELRVEQLALTEVTVTLRRAATPTPAPTPTRRNR